MPISDICNVVITATTTTPTRQGYGTPLIAACTVPFSSRVVEYGSLSEMVTAGFTTANPTYLCALKVFSNNPRPPSVKVGRRALPPTQVFTLTCLDATTGDVYDFYITGATGTKHHITYTVPGASTTTSVATAIAALITTAAPNGMATAAGSGAIITVTSTSGKLLNYLSDATHLTFAETTTDPGIATDLAAIYAADSNWYGLLLDNNSKLEVEAAAAWAEANGQHLFGYNSTDAACADGSSTTDVMYFLKAAAYARTYGLYSQSELLSYSAASWMGNRFPFDPGSDTWAFKTLPGVMVDVLTDAQVHNVEAKNGNVYTTVAGINITQFGKCASGTFVDQTRFIDWLSSTIQTNVFGLLANNAKIPFTDAGIDAVRSTIMGVLQQGVDVGGLSSSPAPIVFVPKASAVDATNKAARNLPNVKFTATLAGAIHSMTINGTLSV